MLTNAEIDAAVTSWTARIEAFARDPAASPPGAVAGLAGDIVHVKGLKAASAVPTVILTFDYYVEAYLNAFPIMQRHGLVGTWFVDPFTVDYGSPALPTSAQLREMVSAGWEIGGYPRYNMVSLLNAAGSTAAKEHLQWVHDTLVAKGFAPTSFAPNQRSWNASLRNLAQGIFSAVRVADNFSTLQAQPAPDMLYVKDGGSNSLSAVDTAASLIAQLDALQATSSAWIVVAHKVGAANDPNYSVDAAVFEAFCADIARRRDAGLLRVVPFGRLNPPVLK